MLQLFDKAHDPQYNEPIPMLQEIGNGGQFSGVKKITYTTFGEYTVSLFARAFLQDEGGFLGLSITPPPPDEAQQMELLINIGVYENPNIIKKEPENTTLMFCLEPDDTLTLFDHSFIAS